MLFLGIQFILSICIIFWKYCFSEEQPEGLSLVSVPSILIHFHLDQGGRRSLYREDWISPSLHVEKYAFITCHSINSSMYLKLPQGFSESFYFLYLIVKRQCYCVCSFRSAVLIKLVADSSYATCRTEMKELNFKGT